MKFTNYIPWLAASFIGLGCHSQHAEISTPPSTQYDTSSKISQWITTPDEQNLLNRRPSVKFDGQTPSGKVITIDTSTSFQQMSGFGYTLTSGSAYVINKLPAADKSKLLQELFGLGEGSISVNFLRLSIGASDLSAEVYTYDDMPAGESDPNLEHFSLAKDEADVIPLIKEILAVNPDIELLATPWTPPVWMKDNGNSVGGSLKPANYGVYAKYFVRYIQEMKKHGITIHGITPQNEPLHPGNNPSMLMTALQQTEFIKNHLGPAFKAADITTKIIVYDHNCDKPDYPITILNDPAAKAFVDGSAFHMYAGDISALSLVKQLHPDKNIYFTEQYTAIEASFSGDLRWHVKTLIIGAPRNWSKTVLEWNLANDENFGPHTPGGCTTCKGALTINGTSIKRNVAYYIIAHASKFVPAGSVRVESNTITELPNVAFKTPSGKIVLIVVNDGASSSTFFIRIGDKSGKVNLNVGAVGTFVI